MRVAFSHSDSDSQATAPIAAESTRNAPILFNPSTPGVEATPQTRCEPSWVRRDGFGRPPMIYGGLYFFNRFIIGWMRKGLDRDAE